jgi:ribose transport system ATP-binding protein
MGVGEIGRDRMIRLIVGSELAASLPDHLSSVAVSGERTLALTVHGLASRRIRPMELAVREGEVLGIAGLTGSGREELARALVGAIPSRLLLVDREGKACVNPTPRQAMRFGVCLVLPSGVPGSGSHELTVRENVTLPHMKHYSRFGFIRRRAELDAVRRWIGALDVRPADPERALQLLSGGNQQKVVFGKWLSLRPSVLVLDEPTSGVDVGARAAIYELIRAEAEQGKAFIICSSDLEDLLAVCHRVLVLHAGRISAELAGAQVDEARILSEMMGVDSAVNGVMTK